MFWHIFYIVENNEDIGINKITEIFCIRLNLETSLNSVFLFFFFKTQMIQKNLQRYEMTVIILPFSQDLIATIFLNLFYAKKVSLIQSSLLFNCLFRPHKYILWFNRFLVRFVLKFRSTILFLFYSCLGIELTPSEFRTRRSGWRLKGQLYLVNSFSLLNL